VKRRALPSAEYLRECFSYDPGTGALVWKNRPLAHFRSKWAWRVWNIRYANKPAGHINNEGYYHIRLNNTLYQAHRIIFKLITNEEPPAVIDHQDGNTGNNRWANLRAASPSQSIFNRGPQWNSSSGIRGVRRFRKRWQAQITAHGVTRHLGTFDTSEEAAAAYEKAAREVHGEFYRGGERQ